MKILYFGTYARDWGRSNIYIKGLREKGIEVLECHDNSPSLLKYLQLFLKHWKLRGSYDVVVVGYPGHAVVWFARLISGKKIIFDALCTMEEGVIVSRGQKGLKYLYIKFVDWLAVKCSHVVLVETEEQRKYFEQKFGKSEKYRVIYTGANDSIFSPDPAVQKKERFTVLFRGKFLPEAGVAHIIEAAKLLEDQDIYFVIIGNGWMENNLKLKIKNLKLNNLELISENLEYSDLRNRMLSCHVSLGQFESHERLQRTIPHKCFESLALGLPYVTARVKPVAEILKEGESVVFVNPADPQDLAEKILYLKNNPEKAKNIGENGCRIYQESFTPKALARKIINLLCEF